MAVITASPGLIAGKRRQRSPAVEFGRERDVIDDTFNSSFAVLTRCPTHDERRRNNG
jgi:hypothetical protein